MKYVIVQLSERRFAVGQLNEGGEANLQIFSKNELGQKDEMVEVNRVELLSKPLKFEQAMKFYCYKATGTAFTDELWEMLKDD